MKKELLLAGLLAVTASARALVSVSANGGYSTVTMADQNASLDKAKQSLAGTPNLVSTPYGGGWFVGAEAGLGLLPFLELGPRVEYMQAAEAGLSGDISGVSTKYALNSNLTSGMIGAKVSMDMPLTGLGFAAGIYGGYGYATTRSTVNAGGVTIGTLSTGGGFVGELEAKIKYSIIPLVSIDLLGGFRMANMGKLKDGDTADKNDSDFSGLNVGGGLTIGF
jgi:hypothetical protein